MADFVTVFWIKAGSADLAYTFACFVILGLKRHTLLNLLWPPALGPRRHAQNPDPFQWLRRMVTLESVAAKPIDVFRVVRAEAGQRLLVDEVPLRD